MKASELKVGNIVGFDRVEYRIVELDLLHKTIVDANKNLVYAVPLSPYDHRVAVFDPDEELFLIQER